MGWEEAVTTAAYLRTLSAHIRLDFQLNAKPLSVLPVHDSPRRINEYPFEDRDGKSMLRIMEQASADIIAAEFLFIFPDHIPTTVPDLRGRPAVDDTNLGCYLEKTDRIVWVKPLRLSVAMIRIFVTLGLSYLSKLHSIGSRLILPSHMPKIS
ncbi:hypothetical protein LXM25_13170 [Dyadobacter sp. LJ53]|uniref:hypothetical protein n=1 Tax=Dyadobacter chenwenxiniae TaxID=2906456 RepID=UPI001F427C7D|nr:hypothetical protein [Dyadobacter chenwenxiniae]MCF0051018.1 hypothetical protein [Dyadobacter chenwenxiniae]